MSGAGTGAGATAPHSVLPSRVSPRVGLALLGAVLPVAALSLWATWPSVGVVFDSPGGVAAAERAMAVLVVGLVCLAAVTCPLLPGAASRLPTFGWVQAVAAGVLLWVGPAASLAVLALVAVGYSAIGLATGMPALERVARTLALAVGLGIVGFGSTAWGVPVGVPSAGEGAARGLVLMTSATLVLVLCLVADVVTQALLDVSARSRRWREALAAEMTRAPVTASHLLAAPLVALALTNAPVLVFSVVVLLSAVELLGVLGRRSRRESLRDPLTGLANRRDFTARLRAAVASANAASPTLPLERRLCAVLLVDLDNFKETNDEHGHAVGDLLLVSLAHRLRQVAGRRAVVARLGGDEFAVLLTDVRDPEVAQELALRIREALAVPVQVAEREVSAGGSVGVALAPVHARDASSLMRRADAAMYAAKRRDGVEMYTAAIDERSSDRRAMVSSLRHALDTRRVSLVYQPQVRLQPGSADSVPTCGAVLMGGAVPMGGAVLMGGAVPSPYGREGFLGLEALLRWNDPARGPVPPDSFIPVAEQAGLIGRLTGVVLELALEQQAVWLRAGLRLPVAVNVSLRDLEDPGFAERTARALVAAGVPSSLLTLEITERVLAGDLGVVADSLARLRRVGVRLSLDDFGTGWSSLLLLRRLPLDELKLDRAFVSNITHEPADEHVVRSVLGLARALGLHTLAEGVEDDRTQDLLRRLGCDAAQGYHIARPLTPAQVVSWLAEPGSASRGREHLRVVS